MISRVLLVLTVLALTACASLPGKKTVTVNKLQTQLVISRLEGTTPVIFENGLGGRLDWWAKIVPELARDTTVLAYNRPGYGNSSAPVSPRDGQHVVEELRVLLRSQGLQPPYVLVGHSLGGLYIQWYARRYPEEVKALVLVDSTHPRQMQGEGSPDHWPWWVRMVMQGLTSAVAKEELLGINRTGDDVLAMPAFPGERVVILSARKPMSGTSALARDANAKRVDLLRLYPGARQVWVDSGHGIPLEKPEAVIKAVREMLEMRAVVP
ncbi:MAG: alpha/beta fold hydrolase [Fluviicoccus sp.]|uniref:alpha/beta fold hydrolase n=1 Tax=Fluviicoccus sp. TaxID=2003552 RepID=UPI002724B938|nr:alpha/beta fold hydrolase [Fluviicoccus sp.]MDO8329111.1 alpha/beta fold hydrolase [Fluviicoccus sp.]